MKNFWYINHKGLGPLRVMRGGSYTCAAWEGYSEKYEGIVSDVTLYFNKKAAKIDLDSLRQSKSKREQKNFKILKVVVKK